MNKTKTLGITPKEKRLTWSGDPKEIPEDWPPADFDENDSQNIKTPPEQNLEFQI